MIYLIIRLLKLPSFIIDMVLAPIYKRAMKSCGKNVFIRPLSSDIKGLENLTVGNCCNIPKGSTFFCTKAPLTIGNKVVFGPHPTIITGDHQIDFVGKYIVDITDEEKKSGLDAPVTIEDDVWCGANVTILKGVTIGRGCVVAAGSVVTKSFPPYSIIGGTPAKFLKYRFTADECKTHEEMLYAPGNRLTKSQLAHLETV